jgi:hypothetical protein
MNNAKNLKVTHAADYESGFDYACGDQDAPWYKGEPKAERVGVAAEAWQAGYDAGFKAASDAEFDAQY